MRDKYDAQIEVLLEAGDFDSAVYEAWLASTGLFAYAFRNPNPSEEPLGCLTMIKKGVYAAQTPELTAAIRADTRLPSTPREITREMLPVFAEWQRRLDKELGTHEETPQHPE